MYAQGNEDQIISDFFGVIKGNILDIGANDGKTFSNSRYLIERGWKAALIEPSPAAFSKLKELYGETHIRVWLLNAAIANNTGAMKFYEMTDHLGKGDVALLSTLLPEEMERWTGTEFNEIEVSTCSVKKMLELSPFSTFDFISIDCEGMDYDIMRQINYDTLETRCICVEWNSKDFFKFDGVARAYGFTLLHKNAENLIYIR